MDALSNFYNAAGSMKKSELMGTLRRQRPASPARVRARVQRPSRTDLMGIAAKLAFKKNDRIGAQPVGTDEDPNAGFLSSDEDSDEGERLAVALYDYHPDSEHSNDLSFNKGDAIHVFSKDQSGGWWLGETCGDIPARGMFPANYVRPLETPKRGDLSGRFRLRSSCEYQCIATRVLPDIRSTKVRDLPKDSVFSGYKRAESRRGNVFLQLRKGDWVFMYDFDASGRAIPTEKLIEKVVATRSKGAKRRPGKLQSPEVASESSAGAKPKSPEPAQQSDEPLPDPEVGMTILLRRRDWYNRGRITAVNPAKSEAKRRTLRVTFDVSALPDRDIAWPPSSPKDAILINCEGKRAMLAPTEGTRALGMFTVEDPVQGMYMGWYDGVIQDVRQEAQGRWRVVVKYRDGTVGTTNHPAKNLIVLFKQKDIESVRINPAEARLGSSKSLRARGGMQKTLRRYSTLGMQEENGLLRDFFAGDMLMALVTNSRASVLAKSLPVMLNALSLTPVWLRDEMEAVLKIVCDKVNSSSQLSQLYAWAVDSNSVYNKGLFSGRIAYATQKPFWDDLGRLSSAREVKANSDICVPTDRITILHPFIPSKPVTRMRVVKVFESNTRPFLVDMYTAQCKLPVPVLVKFGDDFRQDVACMEMFRLMNYFWREDCQSYMRMPVECKTYQCVAGGHNLGFIEFVKDCKCLYESKSAISSLRQEQFHRLIATGAGSYIASYVLGIRDRHADNILIHKDGTLFHIDFGHVLGDTVTIDTHPFAITSSFKKQLGTKWKEFLDECVKAFLVLRRPDNAQKLIQYATVCFASMYPEHKVVGFLRKQLYMHRDVEKASQKIRKLIDNAPKSYRTRFKNVLHAVAVSMKG